MDNKTTDFHHEVKPDIAPDAVVTLKDDSHSQTFSARKGMFLADLLKRNGITLETPCGGKGICKKCTVSIAGTPCLACQTKISTDITVQLAGKTPSLPGFFDSRAIPEATAPFYSHWGLAIDIGTTTIHMSLIGGGTATSAVSVNPQTAMGADIISRIETAMHGGLTALTESLRAALRDMINGLTRQRNITADAIDGAVITGNTTMLYLLTGKNPGPLGTAPFEADCLFGENLPAGPLALGLSSSAIVHIPRCVSAFAGADMVTAILASGMADGDKTALLADIGTNGELVLMHDGRFYCTSTAAGPAFEGYGLSCGSYGVKGAIDKVWSKNGKICFSTIDHAPAIGICGSGIVDALSVLLSLGIMDGTGYLGQPVELQAGIRITGEDVRKIQLAKSAIRSGIETLIEIAGIPRTSLEDFYIAGAFGNYLDLNHAAMIGLFPPALLSAAHCIGNSAHNGAVMILQNKDFIKKTAWIAECAQVIPLTSNPVFSEYFLTYMMF